MRDYRTAWLANRLYGLVAVVVLTQAACSFAPLPAEESLSRCRQVLGDLEIHEPFDLDAFLAYVARLRGRRIDVKPFTARHGLCGAWIQARHADYIYHDQQTTNLHRTHIVVHEIAHMLLGHEGSSLIVQDLFRELAPGLGAELTGIMFGRSGSYASVQEREAETLASLILKRANRLVLPAPTTMGPAYGRAAAAGSGWKPPCAWRRRQAWSRSYQQLRPLSQALYDAVPSVALPHGHVAGQGLAFRLYRRVIEIRDGELALRAYRDPEAIAAAESRACRAGLSGHELDAAIEAAAVATAIRAKAAGQAPSDGEASLPSVDPGRGLAHEIEWLALVSRIFAHFPIIREPGA